MADAILERFLAQAVIYELQLKCPLPEDFTTIIEVDSDKLDFKSEIPRSEIDNPVHERVKLNVPGIFNKGQVSSKACHVKQWAFDESKIFTNICDQQIIVKCENKIAESKNAVALKMNACNDHGKLVYSSQNKFYQDPIELDVSDLGLSESDSFF